MTEIYEPELRLGRWQDVAPKACDALIFDGPFSERTHTSSTTRNDGSDPAGLTPEYDFLTEDDVHRFVQSWTWRCLGWMVSVTDDILAPVWRKAMKDADRVDFQVPCIVRGMSCRMQGDGHSSEALYAVCGRPRNKEFATWGTLPGFYLGSRSPDASGGRGKPGWLFHALVRDHSRAGDLVVDPFCGWGVTLEACRALGRRSIGIDLDADAIEEAKRRLRRPVQTGLFG